MRDPDPLVLSEMPLQMPSGRPVAQWMPRYADLGFRRSSRVTHAAPAPLPVDLAFMTIR